MTLRGDPRRIFCMLRTFGFLSASAGPSGNPCPASSREEENHAENFSCKLSCNCHVRWLGRREGAACGQAQATRDVLQRGTAVVGSMRLRSVKNDLPEGPVLPLDRPSGRPTRYLLVVRRWFTR